MKKYPFILNSHLRFISYSLLVAVLLLFSGCEKAVGPIHPEESRYYWDNADKIVNYAKANGMLMHCSAIIKMLSPVSFSGTFLIKAAGSIIFL